MCNHWLHIDEEGKMTIHRQGTREQWREARLDLLTAEKELTRRSDELARRRRALPWVAVDKRYSFDTASGRRKLAELFDGRSQLLVYHFMFAPDWSEGCPVCSFWADSFDRGMVHLNQRDVTMVCVSRAPLPKLESYRRRMGWGFEWVSSHDDFNYDFDVSLADDVEHAGLSAFALEGGVVYHTYSCYARGLEAFNGAYQLLDRAPKGRDEEGLPMSVAWLRRHDQYEALA
jgi:predicted dithiol-disulfide oxidoreductase (DUF899 family)